MAKKSKHEPETRHEHPLGRSSRQSELVEPFTPAPKSSRFSGGWLFLIGVGLVLAGVGLATAPLWSWRVSKVGQELAQFGFSAPAMAFSGLTFLGLWLVTRSVAKMSARSDMPPPRRDERDDVDLALLFSQLSNEVRGTHQAVVQFAHELSSIGEVQRSLLSEPSEPVGHGQDALFRLAASLDQLHARLDEQAKRLERQFTERIESVVSSVERTRVALESRPVVAAAPAPVPAPVAPVAQRPIVAPTPPAPTFAVQPQVDEIDEVDVVVDFDDERFDDPALEFFDTIEELDAMVREEGGGSGLGLQELEYDEPGVGSAGSAGSGSVPKAGGPSRGQGPTGGGRGPRPALPRRDQGGQGVKGLEPLDALLPDDVVRRALDQDRR